MKTQEPDVVPLALLPAAVERVPMVSARENHTPVTGKIVRNQNLLRVKVEERNKIAAQLWKKDIPQTEFIKKVFPEVYNGLSDTGKKQYAAEKMNWPTLTKGKNTQGTYSSDGKLLSAPSRKSLQEAISAPVTSFSPISLGVSSISANGRSVNHKSESWIVFPPHLNVPYIGIVSYLIMEQDGDEILIDTVVNARYWVNTLKAKRTSPGMS